MRLMRVRNLLCAALCAAFTTSAQTTNSTAETRSLSLRDCLELALSRNLDLQIQHLATDAAGFEYRSSYGAYVPRFSFEARHDFLSQPANFDPDKINVDYPYELQNNLFGPSLEGKLPIGLEYGVSAYTREDNARSDFRSNTNAFELFPGGIRTTNNYFSEAQVRLQQHLLKDAWIDADRLLIQIRRKDLKISEQALRFQVMKTVLAVELAYYDLLTARENLRVLEKTLELRQQLVNETRRRVQVGDLPPLDADQSETQLQNTLTAITGAREALVTQQNRLKRLISDNFREWVDIDLRPADSLLVIPRELNRSESFFSALKNRPDLIEARIAVEKRDVTVRFHKNQLFPNLDLIGGYGGLGVAGEPDRSIDRALSFDNQAYYYGVVLSFPLSNLSERGSYQISKVNREISKLQLKRAEEDVLVQIADYINRAQSRYSQLDSTRKARAFAEAALSAEQKKLQNGLSTSFVVLQLQETLTAARTTELQALADYNKVIAQLEFADATILDRHRLNVEVK